MVLIMSPINIHGFHHESHQYIYIIIEEYSVTSYADLSALLSPRWVWWCCIWCHKPGDHLQLHSRQLAVDCDALKQGCHCSRIEIEIEIYWMDRGWDWLVNVPKLGDWFHITKNSHICWRFFFPIVGWCEPLGHLPTPVCIYIYISIINHPAFGVPPFMEPPIHCGNDLWYIDSISMWVGGETSKMKI